MKNKELLNCSFTMTTNEKIVEALDNIKVNENRRSRSNTIEFLILWALKNKYGINLFASNN